MNDKTEDAMEEIHNMHMKDVLKRFIYSNLTHLLPFNSKIDEGIEFRFESIFKKPEEENKFHSRLALRYSNTEIKAILNSNINKIYIINDNRNFKKHEFIGFIKSIETEMINDSSYINYHKFNNLRIMVNAEEFPDISKIEYPESITHMYNGIQVKPKKYKITLEELPND